MIRYRTLDLPPNGAAAFTPVPAYTPVASSYGLVHIYGAPGTQPVPSPKPQNDWAYSLTRRGGVNSAQDSMCAPDVILPAIYIPDAKNMGPAADTGLGMARRRLTELPIPAVDPGRLPVAVFIPAAQRLLGGRRAIPWPRAFQRWPNKVPITGRQ